MVNWKWNRNLNSIVFCFDYFKMNCRVDVCKSDIFSFSSSFEISKVLNFNFESLSHPMLLPIVTSANMTLRFRLIEMNPEKTSTKLVTMHSCEVKKMHSRYYATKWRKKSSDSIKFVRTFLGWNSYLTQCWNPLPLTFIDVNTKQFPTKWAVYPTPLDVLKLYFLFFSIQANAIPIE